MGDKFITLRSIRITEKTLVAPEKTHQKSTPPRLREVPEVKLPAYETFTLANGVPVHYVSGGTQDVIKLEIVFLAGKTYESHRAVAKCTAALLTEGTAGHSSEELAEHFDFYGAVVSTMAGLDTARVRLYCLNRHLQQILPVLQEVIESPTFPEDEIDTYRDNRQERIRIDLEKNEHIGYRKLTELLFGADHPYGYNTVPEDLDIVTREMLVSHHRMFYQPRQMAIYASGKINTSTLNLLNRYFGQAAQEGERHVRHIGFQTTGQRRHTFRGPQAHQASIRIGRPMFKRTHPDFPGMYVANALLGGYFGSRLMTNIREDKGLTYGIYSNIDTFSQGGCFYISTEVSKKNVRITLDEIYKEIERLKTEPVPDEELRMVKNYLMGSFMMRMDGPFNAIDVIKSLLLETDRTDHFATLIRKIRQITPHEIQALLNTYLDPDDLVEIIVGQTQ